MARMRLCLIFVVFVFGTASGLPNVKLNTIDIDKPMNADTVSCRSGYELYQGWCVFRGTTGEVVYDDAVNTCNSVGSYAPSIHSESDLDFWTTYIMDHNNAHFWLDAYCTSNGQNYKWRDGTPTDYLGPFNELQNCQLQEGYHLHYTGFDRYPYSMPALPVCAYPCPTCLPATTSKPTTTTPRPTTTTPRPTTTNPYVPVDYCTCNPSTVYLDIVFVVDSSDDMTSVTVGDVTATIKSTLYGLTFGTGHFQSNVAVVAFAETVQTVRNFGGFKSKDDIKPFFIPYLGGNADKMEDAIKQATSMLKSNGRSFSRGVIVLFTNSFDQRKATNIEDAANAFKDDDGQIIITLDYSKGLGLDGLRNVASPEFYINDTSLSNPNLDADLLYAFCDANCFCKDDILTPFNAPNERGRDVPNGCYRVADFNSVYEAAEDNCEAEKGFVATVHDDDKSFFLLSLFPPTKPRYWIGLQKNGSNFEWADGANDKSTRWAPGNPISGQDCVYSQQQSGFNSPWFSAPCTDPLKNSMTYACQLRPCSSEYDCWA